MIARIGRVFLAAADPALRSALRLLLECEDGLAVVGDGGAAGSRVALAAAAAPDLVVLSWPTVRATPDLVAALRALPSHPRLIALTGRPEDRPAIRLAGVDAMVCSSQPPERLLSAVRALLDP